VMRLGYMQDKRFLCLYPRACPACCQELSSLGQDREEYWVLLRHPPHEPPKFEENR
jgi:hypothetical protein